MGGDSSKYAVKGPAPPPPPPANKQPPVKHGSTADIHVKAIEAKELNCEPGSPPNARITVGVVGNSPDTFQSSKMIPANAAPQWDHHFIVPVDSESAVVLVEVIDTAHGNISLGTYKIPVADITPKNEPKEMWVPLQGASQGEIHLQLTYVEAHLASEFEGFGKTKFFANVSASRADPKNVDLARDYIIIVDKSGSMSGSKWTETCKTLQILAPWVCGADPDGITLYLFSNTYDKYENITDKDKVQRIFKANSPGGSTNLSSVLDAAFKEHFGGTRRRTTVLCITDGSPDSTSAVVTTIKKAANTVSCEEELSLTFIQIGNDDGARSFLKMLDDDLETPFDIVDTVTSDEFAGMNFEEFVTKSLYD